MINYQGIEIKEGAVFAYSEMPHSNYADSIGVIENGKFVSHVIRYGYNNNFRVFIDEIPVELSYHLTDESGRIQDLTFISAEASEEFLTAEFAHEYFDEKKEINNG